MSRYDDAFTWLAARGEPAGATAVLERVQEELDAGPAFVHLVHPRRFLGGPVLAVAVFLTVLGVVATVWAVRNAGDEAVDAAGIEWITAGSQPTMGIVGGPGGFVSHSFRAGAALRFSSDGTTWEDVTTAEMANPQLIPQQVTSGSDGWTFFAIDRDEAATMWTSPDGRTWTAASLPDQLANYLVAVAQGPGGYVAWTAAPFADTTATLWWSADANAWTQIEPAVFASGLPDRIYGGGTGYVAWDRYPAPTGADPYLIYTSPDGVDWVAASLEMDAPLASLATEWELTATGSTADTWMIVGIARGPSIEPTTLVWTSPDGVTWQAAPTPPFEAEDGLANHVRWLLPGDGALVAIVEEGELVTDENGIRSYWDGGKAQAWATTDGITWVPGQQFEPAVRRAAVAVVDGKTIGWWDPGRRPQLPAVVPTTVTSPPRTDLDPAGVALQDEILADGAVTREEFEAAVAAMAECLTDHGLAGVHWSVDDRGGFSHGYETGSPDADDEASAIDNYCRYSFVERVATAQP